MANLAITCLLLALASAAAEDDNIESDLDAGKTCLLQTRMEQTHMQPEEIVMSCATEEDKTRANAWVNYDRPGNKWCTDRGGLAAFWKYDRQFAGAYALTAGKAAWHDPLMTTVDGVYAQEAEYCLAAGLLDLPNRESLLNNITALTELKDQMCSAPEVRQILQTKLLDVIDIDIDVSAMLTAGSEYLQIPEEDRPPFYTPERTLMRTALACEWLEQGCVNHWCLSTFCRLSDGRVGSGCQCNEQWGLDPNIPQADDLESNSGAASLIQTKTLVKDQQSDSDALPQKSEKSNDSNAEMSSENLAAAQKALEDYNSCVNSICLRQNGLCYNLFGDYIPAADDPLSYQCLTENPDCSDPNAAVVCLEACSPTSCGLAQELLSCLTASESTACRGTQGLMLVANINQKMEGICEAGSISAFQC